MDRSNLVVDAVLLTTIFFYILILREILNQLSLSR